MKSFTVNVSGNCVTETKQSGYHAYHSQHTNVTAIEIKAKNKTDARKIGAQFGQVLFVFE